jgi:hypothetical protein
VSRQDQQRAARLRRSQPTGCRARRQCHVINGHPVPCIPGVFGPPLEPRSRFLTAPVKPASMPSNPPVAEARAFRKQPSKRSVPPCPVVNDPSTKQAIPSILRPSVIMTP